MKPYDGKSILIIGAGLLQVPAIETANKLQIYISAYRDVWKKKGSMNEQLRIISMLREELEASLEQLSKPKTLSMRV